MDDVMGAGEGTGTGTGTCMAPAIRIHPPGDAVSASTKSAAFSG